MITPTIFAVGCHSTSFFGFPTWYQYLPTGSDGCSPALRGIGDIWLIVAAILGIMLRVAALAAVLYVVYGGARYILSQGNPDATTQARGTILNAVIGLFIAITAAIIVQFIASRFN